MNTLSWMALLLVSIILSASGDGGMDSRMMAAVEEATQEESGVLGGLAQKLLTMERRSRRLAAGSAATMTDADRNAILNAVNQYRSETAQGQTGSQPGAQAMETLAWDGALESVARRHVEQCQWAMVSGLMSEYTSEPNNQAAMFSGGMYMAQGIGLSTASGSVNVALSMLQSWFDQHKDYTLSNDSCAAGRSCGLYKQIVRGATRFVGCAYKVCNMVISGQTWNGATLLTCTWLGHGSSGTGPYVAVTGSNGICSGCPAGRQTCVNGMCSAIVPTAMPTAAPTQNNVATPCTGYTDTIPWLFRNGHATAQQYESALKIVAPCVQITGVSVSARSSTEELVEISLTTSRASFDYLGWREGMISELAKIGVTLV